MSSSKNAWIIVGIAPVWRRPDTSSEIVTRFHFGEEIVISDPTSGFPHATSKRDGYEGFIKRSNLTLDHEPLPIKFVSGMGAYVYVEPDLRSSPLDFLPRNAAVQPVGTEIMTRGSGYVRLQDSHFIPTECLTSLASRSQDVVQAAELYLGTPYLWGGRSRLGIDCAGLVQAACEEIGLSAMRDVAPQVTTLGQLIEPFDLVNLEPGDLLYITGHVMIYAGGGAVIHSDGRSMRVIKQPLLDLIAERTLSHSDFTIRRL